MIEAHNLTRRYGEFTAVEDVSFSVADGEIVGMLGPNGAGKTTTLRMITGFLPPSSGRVTLAGHDLATSPGEARRELGYLPENVSLYPELRVREYLQYRALLEGMSRADAAQRIPETLERCLLTDVAGQVIGTLSKGYRQRVGLATAILHQPRVLVLDEPTVGLDPKQIVAIRELIRELRGQHTLLLSTHILPEVELLCDRVMIIDGGRLVASGTPESLQQQWVGHARLSVELKGEADGAPEVLAAIPGVTSARPAGEAGRWALEVEGDSAAAREAVFRAAVERGWVLLELSESGASLEDIFVRLTTREPAATQDSAAEEPPEEPEVES